MSDKILKFSASWCVPCRSMTAQLKTVDLGVPVEEVDVDANQDLAREYGIRSVPTLIYLHEGREVSRQTGATPVDRIKSWISNAQAQ